MQEGHSGQNRAGCYVASCLAMFERVKFSQRTSQFPMPKTSIRLAGASLPSVVLGLALLIVGGFLLTYGLGNNAFWDDEANTALFGRNLNLSGHLTAWDGSNVVGFRQGAELDVNLVNVYMPPIQYCIAALGLKLFGNTTLGGRVPFVVLGVLSIYMLMVFSRWHFIAKQYVLLPALLLTLNPAYLMFMRQCRYYAVVSLLTLVLLAAWAYPKRTKASRWTIGALGALTSCLLMLTNYINAVAIVVTLPVLFFLRRYRTRANAGFLIGVVGGLLCIGVYVFVTANPLAINVSYKSSIIGIHRLGLLLLWHIGGLSQFEFFPLIFVVLLVGLALLQQGTGNAVLAKEALLLSAQMIAYSIVVVLLSPQSVGHSTRVADMRYVIALMPIGAIVSAIVLIILWRTSKWLGPALSTVVGGLLVFTNLFTSAVLRWEPPRSTLLEYLLENARDYTTGSEAIVEYLKQLPPGKIVRIIPDYMTYPAMFYVPEQHYCCQLADDHILAPDVRAQLPDYVYFRRALPDYIIVGANIQPQQLLYQAVVAFGPGRYRLGGAFGSDYRDCSRPEIPWHCFGPPRDKHQGFLVLERVVSETS